MKIKNKITLCAAAIVLATAGFVGSRPSHKSPSATVLANLDALLGKESNSEQNKGSLDTNYKREPGDCVLKVGVGSSLKIFGAGILKADATGKISISGQVTCYSDGKAACRPVECIDVLKVILGNAEKE